MKIILQIACVIFLFANVNIVFSQKNKIDTCLVGTWSGAEKDEQYVGVQKSWIQYRFANGKLITRFTITQLGIEDVFTEEGKWWTKDGKFFEKSKGSISPDVYTYEVTDPNHIIFRALKLSAHFENSGY